MGFELKWHTSLLALSPSVTLRTVNLNLAGRCRIASFVVPGTNPFEYQAKYGIHIRR